MSEKREFPILNGKLLSDLDLNGHKLLGLDIPGDRDKFASVVGDDKLVNRAHNLVLSPVVSESKWTIKYDNEHGESVEYVLKPEHLRIDEKNRLIIDPFYGFDFEERLRLCAVDSDNNAITFDDLSYVPDGAINFSTKPLNVEFNGYAPISGFGMIIERVEEAQITHESINEVSIAFQASNGEEVSFTDRIYVHESIFESERNFNIWIESEDGMYSGGCDLGDTLPEEGELIEIDIFNNENGEVYRSSVTMPETFIQNLQATISCNYSGTVGMDDLTLGSFSCIGRQVSLEMAVYDAESGDGYCDFYGVEFENLTGALQLLDGMYGRVYPYFPDIIEKVNNLKALEGLEFNQKSGDEVHMQFDLWDSKSSASLTGVTNKKGGIILTPPDSVKDEPRSFHVVIQDASGSLKFKDTLATSKTKEDMSATVGATNVFRITEPIKGMFVVEKIAGQKTAEIDAALVDLLIKPVTDMTEDEKNLVIQRCAEILGGK